MAAVTNGQSTHWHTTDGQIQSSISATFHHNRLVFRNNPFPALSRVHVLRINHFIFLFDIMYYYALAGTHFIHYLVSSVGRHAHTRERLMRRTQSSLGSWLESKNTGRSEWRTNKTFTRSTRRGTDLGTWRAIEPRNRAQGRTGSPHQTARYAVTIAQPNRISNGGPLLSPHPPHT